MYYFNYISTIDTLQTNLFNKYAFDLVVYDEIETFRHYADPLFSYPYGSRTTYVNSMSVNPMSISYEMHLDFEYNLNTLYNPIDYSYSQNMVYF
mmetsp:Transcript_2389/g.3660  ORF Transcript_2389/g.3660 Transcript_2389/m.3660 type:complete len:94 (+) Transcript_2389:257-538(+)